MSRDGNARRAAPLAFCFGTCFLLLASCGREPEGEAGAPAEEKVVNVANWADNIGPSTIADFTARTGIKVNYDTLESNEVLETKLLTGHTGYDVVFPSAGFLGRLVPLGTYARLDKSKLANLRNLDAEVMRQASAFDPGNDHAIVYQWGTSGIAYNPDLVAKVAGTGPIDSWRALFDPAMASRLAKCGIALLDDPMDAFDAAMIYLGLDLDENPESLAAAEALLTKLRPNVRYFNSSRQVTDLATGEICVALTWSGNALQARARGLAAEPAMHVNYVIPKEGAVRWFDMVAIPADAPHPGNAHALLDYLMEPEVIAGVTNVVGFANANVASLPYVDDRVRGDPVVFPGADVQRMLRPGRTKSQEYTRELNRAWTRVKTGQ